MKSMSSGSGLRSVLAIASAPRSATSRRRISASISLRSASMRASYSSRARRSSSGVSPPSACGLGLLHQPLEHAVEVEVPQRAVEVVGAADRPARLHAGEAADRLAGEGPHHGLVAVHQRPVEHLGQLLGGEPLHAAGRRPGRRRAARRAAARARPRRRRLLRRRCCTGDPRSEKYTSKTVSKAFQWALFFTRVAARAYLNASRSSSGMCCTASMASRFSVRLTGRPAARSSCDEPGQHVEHPAAGVAVASRPCGRQPPLRRLPAGRRWPPAP